MRREERDGGYQTQTQSGGAILLLGDETGSEELKGRDRKSRDENLKMESPSSLPFFVSSLPSSLSLPSHFGVKESRLPEHENQRRGDPFLTLNFPARSGVRHGLENTIIDSTFAFFPTCAPQ